MNVSAWVGLAMILCGIAIVIATVYFAPKCDINSPSVRIGHMLVAGCDNETGRSRGLSFPAR